VAGAALGNGLAEWLAEWRREADGRGVADALAEGLSLALGVVELAEPLGRIVGVAEPLAGDENGVGVGEGEGDEQAETDAEATMAKVAQQAAVNLGLRPVPMMVMRIVTGPPYVSAGAGPFSRSRSRHRKRNRGRVGHCPRPAEGRIPRTPDGHKGKAHRRHRYEMACSSSEY
jgi:hypothetical protein